MTREEMLAYLRHSSLPQVVVEGRDDQKLLRLIEKHIPDVSIFPAGGKSSVMFLAGHQKEFSAPIAFLVDSDFWVYDGVPGQAQGIPNLIRTDGYSIENDLGRDVDVEQLLLPTEISAYEHDLDLLSAWFSSHVSNRPACGTSWRSPVRDVTEGSPSYYTASALSHLESFPAEPQLTGYIRSEYRRVLRGKTLTAIQKRYLCCNGRHSQHNPLSLMELAWSRPNGFGQKIISAIAESLDCQRQP